MIPLKDENPVTTFPFWVIVIILLNAFVFYLELTSPSLDNLITQFAFIPLQLNFFDVSTLKPLLTSQFLHAGFLHIISNMLFLWVFGDNIEAVFGFLLFPVFYLLSGVVAGLTQYFFTPQDTIPMLGASGAVAGILGAYFALFPFSKVKTLVLIFFFITLVDLPAYFLLFFWFIIQFFNGVFSVSAHINNGGTAFLPHIGGFIFGWLAASILISRRHAGRRAFGVL